MRVAVRDMSGNGTTRKCSRARGMTAIGGKPDAARNQRFGEFDPERNSGLIDTSTEPQYNRRHCVLQRQTHRMAEERVQRRLAAILAADVVGYSRLMEQDEVGTLAGAETAAEGRPRNRWLPSTMAGYSRLPATACLWSSAVPSTPFSLRS